MKKAIVLLLVAVLLTGCGNEQVNEVNNMTISTTTSTMTTITTVTDKTVEKKYVVTYSAEIVRNSHVGDSWSFGISCGGITFSSGEQITVTVSPDKGPTLTIWAKEHDDKNSDFGKKDIIFSNLSPGQTETITEQVVVTENSGRYSGYSAYIEFTVTITNIFPSSNENNHSNTSPTSDNSDVENNTTADLDSYIEHTHQWDNGTVTIEASCAQEGCKVFICTACKSIKEEIIPKKDHNFTQKVESYNFLKSPRTYTTGSVYFYSCACGEQGSKTFSLDDRIEWITSEMLQRDFNLLSDWIGESELRIWTDITEIGEQSDSYLIYDQMRNGMGNSVYNGSYNGVTIRFYCDPEIYSGSPYVFNYDDLVAAGII